MDSAPGFGLPWTNRGPESLFQGETGRLWVRKFRNAEFKTGNGFPAEPDFILKNELSFLEVADEHFRGLRDVQDALLFEQAALFRNLLEHVLGISG